MKVLNSNEIQIIQFLKKHMLGNFHNRDPYELKKLLESRGFDIDGVFFGKAKHPDTDYTTLYVMISTVKDKFYRISFKLKGNTVTGVL